MSYESLECFQVHITESVANVTIDHAPMNLMDLKMIMELHQLATWLSEDDAVKVIVFRSADPDFFIAHLDLNVLLQPRRRPDPDSLNLLNSTFELFRSMPRVSIAQIEGQAQGGGSEFVLAMDMRFAALGKTRLGQPETSMGFMAAGGGCTRLPLLMGRSRALEVLLGCETFSAEEAERYGYVNRALPTEEIGSYVERLAQRIASFPAQSIAAVKEMANIDPALTIRDRLLAEQNLFETIAKDPECARRTHKALELGLQQRDKELSQFDEIFSRLHEQ